MNPLGKRAYGDWTEAMGGTYPPWEHLPVREMDAWELVAKGEYKEPEPDFSEQPECRKCQRELRCPDCDPERCSGCSAVIGDECSECAPPVCAECDGELTCANCNAPVPVNSSSPDSK